MADELALVLDAHAELGEGPIWDPGQDVLYWVDITKHLVHRYDPATGQDVTKDMGRPVGVVVPRASGGLVLGLQGGFYALDWDTGEQTLLAPVEAEDPGARINDGAVDSRGRFWAGTLNAAPQQGLGGLYRLDLDHHVTKVLGSITISNGICWSADNRRMYFIDTPRHGIDMFSFDEETGAPGEVIRLVDIPAEQGSPDGMVIDVEGFLWVALWDGAAIHRYSPTGELDRVIPMPTSWPTKCAFAGPNLTDLYITSAAGGLAPEKRAAEPHAGGLFRLRPGVAGVPSPAYGG
jgi:sugar lactone lactonase YvrE